jgi:hypothetical protein
MATISFSAFIQGLLSCPTGEAHGNTVREVLDEYFEKQPRVRQHILDDQGCLRSRLSLSVDGDYVTDRAGLEEPVHARAFVYICQMPLDPEYEALHFAPGPCRGMHCATA